MHGIQIIRELFSNNDIKNLAEEKNNAWLGFITLNDNELSDLTFLNIEQGLPKLDKSEPKITVKKIIKYLLPYGIVRLYHRYISDRN